MGATLYTLLSRDTQPNVTKPLAHTLNPNVPENVSLAIHKAMSVAMDSRFQIANDMLSALRDPQWRAAAGASQGSRHSVSPLMWGGGGVVALMVLALALWRLWPLSTPPTEGPGAGGVTAAPPQVATSAPEPTVAATVAVALAPTSAATTVPVPNALYGKTADDAVNQIKQEGIITIGVRLDAPPFGNDAKLRQQMKNTPNNTLCNASIDQPDFQPQGYDILIAREFAKRWLGDERKLKFRCVLVGERINAIRQGTVRIGALSFSALPERCNTTTGVACSIRYMLDGQGILVRKGADIQELCDIKGEKVGVVSNTSAEDLFAEGVKLFCGDPAPEIVPFSTRDDAIAQLLAGSISAYATNLEIIKELANEHPNDLTAVPGEYGEESFSIIVTPSETGLLELVNLTIQAMKKDGTLDALINTAFKSAVPPIDIDFNQNKTFPPYVLGTAPLVPTVTPQATSTTNSSYIVQKGETFSGIARKVYGNSQLWRCIAKANGIDDPKKLQPGPLKIPPKAGC